MLNVVKSLPNLEELTVWTSLEHVKDLHGCDFLNIHSLKLRGLNHPTFLEDMSSLIGNQLTCLKIETIHFDVDISLLGKQCKNIEELNVIDARIKVSQSSDEQSRTFSKL